MFNMVNNEMWKDIPNYEGIYQVSNMGRFCSLTRTIIDTKGRKSIKKATMLKTSFDKDGYIVVALYKYGKVKLCKAHRLVAQAFIPNECDKPCVNHRNGVKCDNRVENLEWCTFKENNLHKFRTLKRNPARPMLGKKGKDNPHSKIVLQINNNEIIAEFYGVMEAARQTGLKSYSIYQVCQHKMKSTGGYNWKYKEVV